MKTRVISGAVLITITLLCVLLSPVTRIIFFAVAGLLCAYEYSRALEKIEVFCCAWVMYVYICAQATLAFFHAGPVALISCFCAAVFLALFSGILHKKVSGSGALYTLAGVAYPCFLFNLLMEAFVREGAAFSSLFTGLDNHARKVYERAGMRPVRQFNLMSMPLSKEVQK